MRSFWCLILTRLNPCRVPHERTPPKMSRFLSHDKTKADLTEYLAVKTLEYSKDSSMLVITSASGHTRSNNELF